MPYSAYAVEYAPKALLDKYPNPALYEEGTFCVFGEALEEVTGEPAKEVVDLRSTELSLPYIDYLLNTLSPAEVQLTKEQAKILYLTRFKPQD